MIFSSTASIFFFSASERSSTEPFLQCIELSAHAPDLVHGFVRGVHAIPDALREFILFFKIGLRRRHARILPDLRVSRKTLPPGCQFDLICPWHHERPTRAPAPAHRTRYPRWSFAAHIPDKPVQSRFRRQRFPGPRDSELFFIRRSALACLFARILPDHRSLGIENF